MVVGTVRPKQVGRISQRLEVLSTQLPLVLARMVLSYDVNPVDCYEEHVLSQRQAIVTRRNIPSGKAVGFREVEDHNEAHRRFVLNSLQSFPELEEFPACFVCCISHGTLGPLWVMEAKRSLAWAVGEVKEVMVEANFF